MISIILSEFQCKLFGMQSLAYLFWEVLHALTMVYK